MTANTWLGCWSTLPEYTVTAGCAWRDDSGNVDEVQRTGLLDGTTIEWDGLYTITASDVKPFSAHSESLPPSYVSKEDLVGMSVVPIVTLVHQATDVVATSDATGTAGATSNAAVRGSRGSAWDGIGGVLGAAVGGIVLGAAVILA